MEMKKKLSNFTLFDDRHSLTTPFKSISESKLNFNFTIYARYKITQQKTQQNKIEIENYKFSDQMDGTQLNFY